MLKRLIVVINNKANWIGEAKNDEEALYSAESYARTNYLGKTDDMTLVDTTHLSEYIVIFNSTLYEWVES